VCHQYRGLFEIDVLVYDGGLQHVRYHVHVSSAGQLLGHDGYVTDQDALAELLRQVPERSPCFLPSCEVRQLVPEAIGLDLFHQI